MRFDWLAGLLLGSALANGVAADSCTATVGHWKYDLTGLMSSTPLVYTDAASATTYQATICASAKLSPSCAIKDATANKKESPCTVFGSASSAGSYQYLDPDDPKAGVKILYGGGSMCSGDIPGLVYSTWFEIHCNSAISDISKGFVKVVTPDESGESCGYKYSFQWAGACPVEVDNHHKGGGGVSAAVWVPILIILLTFAYCAGGSLYKRHKYGSSGIESIPHIDFLRMVYARCVEQFCPSWAETHERYKPLMDLSDENDLDYERPGGVAMRGEDTVIKYIRP